MRIAEPQIFLAVWLFFYYIFSMIETPNNIAASSDVETKSTLRAECVIIGKTASPKIEIELNSTSRGSFCGHADFNISGSGFHAMLILMPEKVGNVFVQRNGKHVIYPEGDE